MDWVLDTTRPDSVRALRGELRRYLERHAEPGSDIAGATLIFSELLTNAFQHGAGRRAWVSVGWTARRPQVELHDLGEPFELDPKLPEPAATRGRGIYIASSLSVELAVVAKRAGGKKVVAQLPVSRAIETDHDPPRARTDALPSSEEAAPDGTFGRESFLRALVVQLAEAVEQEDGPQAIEGVVSQVGSDVGGRMEQEYRRARELVGALSPRQIGDLYVRLKAAIDGDFYVIEATEERIVLGNRRCPFGDAVKRSPGLCRMTSSVFGGIAARNQGPATVVLEERIAVGDPECRVVVWLNGNGAGSTGVGHRYQVPVADRDGRG